MQLSCTIIKNMKMKKGRKWLAYGESHILANEIEFNSQPERWQVAGTMVMVWHDAFSLFQTVSLTQEVTSGLGVERHV